MGKLHMADTLVLKVIPWPHVLVYMRLGEHTIYTDMSAVLFVNGYLTVMAGESEGVKPNMLRHLQEVVKDSEAYSLESVKSYHVAWLEQLEQG